MSEELPELPRKTPEEIHALAMGILSGAIYLPTAHEDIRDSFGMLMALTPNFIERTKHQKVGAVYEEVRLAQHRAVNGKPLFFSCKFLHEDDVPLLVQAMYQLKLKMPT